MAHIHEQYDFVVTIFVVYHGKVLFVNHPRYGRWVPIGGHVELDEDPTEALFREVKEETNLEVEILSNKPAVPAESDNKFLHTPNYMGVYGAGLHHRHISLNYFVRSKTNSAQMSDEHTDMRWVGMDDLERNTLNLTPSLIFYAKEAIKAEAAAA